MSDTIISVAVAGTTERTVECASALLNDPRFKLEWVLTPAPKPVGRKQEITANPLHTFASTNQIETILIEKKIDEEIHQNIQTLPAIDFLLVVDFGYIVPEWLLATPRKAPVNIHPSALPRWRGSSPGQFVILYGEKNSAVSVIVMNDKLDQGDIIAQIPFVVQNTWDQFRYYQESFALISQQLPEILAKFYDGAISTQTQPLESPTATATRLNREDGFIPWEVLSLALEGQNATQPKIASVLQEAASAHSSLASLLCAACKAFYPWPGVWTKVMTHKGEQRMKILNCRVSEDKSTLILETVQLEGKESASWKQVQSQLRN